MKNIQRAFLAIILTAATTVFADGIAFITNIKGEISVDGSVRPALLSELRIGPTTAPRSDGSVVIQATSASIAVTSASLRPPRRS